MNTPITITPNDILTALLTLAGIAAVVLLVICLVKVISILIKINKFIEKNSDSITDTIQKLPEITGNASIISKNIIGITESAGEIMDGFTESEESDSQDDGGFLGIITVVVSLVQNIVRFFRNQ